MHADKFLVILLGSVLLYTSASQSVSLTLTTNETIPGASSLVNYTFPISLLGGNSCSTGPSGSVLLQLSAPYQQCYSNVVELIQNTPGIANAVGYCDVTNSLQPTSPGIAYPEPPCVLPAASSIAISGDCSMYYYLNHTLQPARYSICSYYKAGSNWYPSYNETLNITTTASNQLGQSEGIYMSTTTYVGGGVAFTINPYVDSGSPYVDYFQSIGEPSYPRPCTGGVGGFGNCYVELAGQNAVTAAATNGLEGCVSPLDQNGNLQLPACPSTSTQDPSASLPCILWSSNTGATDSFTMPYIAAGNYMMCAYEYGNLQYPTGSSPALPQLANPLASPFWGTESIYCSGVGSANCEFGSPTELKAVEGTPTPVITAASVGFNTPTVIAGNSATVNFSASGLLDPVSGSSYNALYTYVTPLPSLSTLNPQTFGGIQPLCSNAISNANGGHGITSACGGGTQMNCYQKYAITNLSNAYPGCNPVAGFSPSSDSCSCNPDIPTAGPMQCNAINITPTTLAPGNYLYCGVYQLDYGQPLYVAGGILSVISPPAPQGPPTGVLGGSNLLPLNSAVCFIYGQINSVLLILTLTLLILGAILYTGSHTLPPQQRGTVQGYAMGMLIAGVVGAILSASSISIISLATNTPSGYILVACKQIPQELSSTSTSTSVTTTSTSSTLSTVTSTSTSSTSSTICPGSIVYGPYGAPTTQSLSGDLASGCDIILSYNTILYTNGYSMVAANDFIMYGGPNAAHIITGNPSGQYTGSTPIVAGEGGAGWDRSYSTLSCDLNNPPDQLNEPGVDSGIIPGGSSTTPGNGIGGAGGGGGSATSDGANCGFPWTCNWWPCWISVNPTAGGQPGGNTCQAGSSGTCPANAPSGGGTAGGGSASGQASSGVSTSVPGGAGGTSASPNGNGGGTPSAPSISNAVNIAGNPIQYLVGAAGGSGGTSSGNSVGSGPGSNGIYMQASVVNLNGGTVNTIGFPGQPSSSTSQGGGGGGGAGSIFIAYGSSYTGASSYLYNGGAGGSGSTGTGAGGSGGSGTVTSVQYSSPPVPVSTNTVPVTTATNPTSLNNFNDWAVFTSDTSLSGNIIANSISINGGVTVTLDGYELVADNSIVLQGQVVAGPSASNSIYPNSYGGSGGGGGFGGGSSGSANGGNGGAPEEQLTKSLIDYFYCGSLSGCTGPGNGDFGTYYAAGAGGGGGGGTTDPDEGTSTGGAGGNGAYGLYIQANQVIIEPGATITATGGAGMGGGIGDGSGQVGGGGGGGGGGTVVIAYNSVGVPDIAPSSIITIGGAQGAAGDNKTSGEIGGTGGLGAGGMELYCGPTGSCCTASQCPTFVLPGVTLYGYAPGNPPVTP